MKSTTNDTISKKQVFEFPVWCSNIHIGNVQAEGDNFKNVQKEVLDKISLVINQMNDKINSKYKGLDSSTIDNDYVESLKKEFESMEKINSSYTHKIDKDVYVTTTSIYESNEILNIGKVKYSNFYYNNNNIRYSFEDGKNYYSLGCITSRTRDQIVFERGDLKKIFISYLEKYQEKKYTNFAQNIREAIEEGKYLLFVSYNFVGFTIKAVLLRKNSYKYPIALYSRGYDIIRFKTVDEAINTIAENKKIFFATPKGIDDMCKAIENELNI